MSRYTKSDLVSTMVKNARELAKEEGVRSCITSKKQASVILDILKESIEELLAEEGDAVMIQGLVKFEKYLRPAAQKFNVHKGEGFYISPEKVAIRAKSKL